ncbi:MAG: hypothetical protein J6Q38_02310 [Clostridia bacterium]|nr:hypothetical protein [Clostridia bacterium]
MDNVISFTPAELVGFITAIGGAIVTIGAVVTIIFKLVNRLKAPEDKQNERLDALEKNYEILSEDLKEQKRQRDETITQFMQYFTNDDNRFKAIERSNKVTQNALLALLKHALNGNDLQALKDAEKSLEAYLIEK